MYDPSSTSGSGGEEDSKESGMHLVPTYRGLAIFFVPTERSCSCMYLSPFSLQATRTNSLHIANKEACWH